MHKLYNHNREFYVSTDKPIASNKDIICIDEYALFTVKIITSNQTVEGLLRDKNITVPEGSKVHVLELFDSNNPGHLEAVRNALINSAEYRQEVHTSINHISSDTNSEIVKVDFKVPMQYRFVHIKTHSLKYDKAT